MVSTSPPQRIALHAVLAEGHIDEYREGHRRIPDELLGEFLELGIHEWEIWRSGRDVFHLVVCDDFDRVLAGLTNSKVHDAWLAYIGVHIERFEGPDGEGLVPSEVLWTLQGQVASNARESRE